MAVEPGIELPRPFLRIGFLQMGDGNGLYLLVGNLQHPLLETQAAGLRLCLDLSRAFDQRPHQLRAGAAPALVPADV